MDNLSNLNPSSCILSNATKLTNVEIHSSELYNINVTNNKYLRRVDLENCVALGTVTATGSSLNLSNCKYLRYCNVYNTALTEVQLNTSGGSLIEIYYPKTIQNVQLIKQRLLEVVGLPYGKPNMFKNYETLEGIRYTWGESNRYYYDEPNIIENSLYVTFKGKIFVEYGINYIFKLPGNGSSFRISEFDKDNKYVGNYDIDILSAGLTEGTYTPSAENVSFICIVGARNISLAKQLRILREGQGDVDETPTSLYNIDIEECPSIKKLNTSSDPNIYNTFASMVYCNNLTLRNALDLQTLNFDGFHRLTKVIIENMYNLETVGFNNLLPKGETSTIKYIGLSNCPLLETIEMNCTSNDYEITFSDGAILNFGGLLALKTITSNCVLKGIKTIVLPLGLESMFFTNEYGNGYSTIQNLWSSVVCNVNTDGATPKATHVDSTYIGIDFANMNLKNIDLGALVNIPKAINFRLSPTTVNPHFNLNRDGETYPYLKPIGTLDLSNYTESLARFFDGVDLDKLQIVCNKNLPQTDLSYCFYNSSFSSLSAIENLLTRVSSITNLDYCFYRTTVDSLNVLNEINMGANSTMNYTFAECPNIRTLSNITISRNVTSVEGMFKGCPLTSISNITVNVAGSINGLFMGCNQLTTINTFRIPNVTDLSNVFNGCSNLTTLTGFELSSSVTNISNLFNGCYALTTIENFTFSSNITEANTWYPPYLETLQNITINSSAVKLTNCTTLTTIRDFTLGTTDCSSMFEGCTSLTSDIVLPSTIVNCSNMFKNCTSMTHIHSNWNNSYNSEIIPTDCYSGCMGITHIDNENVIAYEGDLGLGYVPEDWGGGGFNAEETSVFEVVIPSDGYTLVIGMDEKGIASTNWGDLVITNDTLSHTYSKSGTYIIKTKNGRINTSNSSVNLRDTLTKILKLRKFIGVNFLFRQCWKLTSINLDNCELNEKTLFYGTLKSNVTELSMVNTKLPSDTSSWNHVDYDDSSPNITEIRGIEDLDVSHVTSFKNLFNNFGKLTSLDLSRWDTSKATDMSNMFKNCSSLIEPPIKNIPISVKNTANMYNGCTSLTEDIIIPTTVTDCTGMFNGCTSMTHIHSNWNNSYVEGITSTDCYVGCTAITHIDDKNVISYENDLGLDYVPTEWGGGGFGVDNTTIYVLDTSLGSSLEITMTERNDLQKPMYINWGDGTEASVGHTHTYAKNGIYYVKVKGFIHTCNSSGANAMPSNTRSIITDIKRVAKLTRYNSDNYVYIDRLCYALGNLGSLKTIDISNWENFDVTINSSDDNKSSLVGLFYKCSSLTTIIGLDKLNTTNITSMKNMFYNCTSLQSLDLSNWNVSNVSDISGMFEGCTSLTSVNFNGWDTSNVQYTNHMFKGCSALTTLNISMFNVSKVYSIQSMFENCTSLSNLNVKGLDFASIDASYHSPSERLFYGCASLTTNPYTDFANLDNFYVIDLRGCDKLTSIDFKNILLKQTQTIGFPVTVREVVGLNLGKPTEVNFRYLSELSKINQLWFGSSKEYNYWYYGGGKAPFETTFVGEIERIPANEDRYTNCYTNGLAIMTEESKTSFVNALKDYTGQETAILYRAASLLSSEQIAIATAKNWSVT